VDKWWYHNPRENDRISASPMLHSPHVFPMLSPNCRRPSFLDRTSAPRTGGPMPIPTALRFPGTPGFWRGTAEVNQSAVSAQTG